jgi:hypothetical protein
MYPAIFGFEATFSLATIQFILKCGGQPSRPRVTFFTPKNVKELAKNVIVHQFTLDYSFN